MAHLARFGAFCKARRRWQRQGQGQGQGWFQSLVAVLAVCAVCNDVTSAEAAKETTVSAAGKKVCKARIAIIAATGDASDNGVAPADVAEPYYAVTDLGGAVDVFSVTALTVELARAATGTVQDRVADDETLKAALHSPLRALSIDGVNAVPKYQAVVLAASASAVDALRAESHLGHALTMFLGAADRTVFALGNGQVALATATKGDGTPFVAGRTLSGAPGDMSLEGTTAAVLSSLGATLSTTAVSVDGSLVTAAAWQDDLREKLLDAIGCKQETKPSSPVHDEL